MLTIVSDTDVMHVNAPWKAVLVCISPINNFDNGACL